MRDKRINAGPAPFLPVTFVALFVALSIINALGSYENSIGMTLGTAFGMALI